MGQVLDAGAVRVIETDEIGRLIIPADLLQDAQPFSRYKVKAVGKKLSIEPEQEAEQREKTYQEWKQEWDALTEEISAAWNTDKSATEIISEMRR